MNPPLSFCSAKAQEREHKIRQSFYFPVPFLTEFPDFLCGIGIGKELQEEKKIRSLYFKFWVSEMLKVIFFL